MSTKFSQYRINDYDVRKIPPVPGGFSPSKSTSSRNSSLRNSTIQSIIKTPGITKFKDSSLMMPSIQESSFGEEAAYLTQIDERLQPNKIKGP